MFTLGTHVQIRLLLDAGSHDENLDLLGRRGVVTQIGTTYPGESYAVMLDEFPEYLPLAFHAVELQEVRA